MQCEHVNVIYGVSPDLKHCSFGQALQKRVYLQTEVDAVSGVGGLAGEDEAGGCIGSGRVAIPRCGVSPAALWLLVQQKCACGCSDHLGREDGGGGAPQMETLQVL